MKRITLQPPLYWVVEPHAEGKPIGMGWFIHTEAPYYRGRSLRLKIGNTAYELGVCRKSGTPVSRDIPVDVQDIREWVGPRALQVEEVSAESSAGEQSPEGKDGTAVLPGVVHVRGDELDVGTSTSDEVSTGPQQP